MLLLFVVVENILHDLLSCCTQAHSLHFLILFTQTLITPPSSHTPSSHTPSSHTPSSHHPHHTHTHFTTPSPTQNTHLPLRVNQQWCPRSTCHSNTILYTQLICGESLYCPFPYLNIIHQHLAHLGGEEGGGMYIKGGMMCDYGMGCV